jgi:formiminotetrahydrofolate cyclodeaminase
MDPLGRPFQQRSVEELVKQELQLERDDHPAKRGCGCAALVGAFAPGLLLLAVKVSRPHA